MTLRERNRVLNKHAKSPLHSILAKSCERRNDLGSASAHFDVYEHAKNLPLSTTRGDDREDIYDA